MNNWIKEARRNPETLNKATSKATAKGFNPYDNSKEVRRAFTKEMDNVSVEIYSEYVANTMLAA